MAETAINVTATTTQTAGKESLAFVAIVPSMAVGIREMIQ
jgi:hypothetical protein